MLNDDDRQRKIAVELFECTEKVGGSNGIKLRGWLVKNDHFGIHYHDRGEIEKLLLTARKGGNIAVEPILDTEI